MTGIIILAAGSSSRLGTPKQNLKYKGKTLLQHVLDIAIDANIGPLVLVLGANKENVLQHVQEQLVTILHNDKWEQGMSGSIGLGINELQKNPDVTDAIIMLSDQPFVSAELLNNILKAHTETNKGIIACAYNNTVGVPALFNAKHFAHLLNLKGDEGARKLMVIYKEDVAVVDFPEGAVDIDTLEDYERLIG